MFCKQQTLDDDEAHASPKHITETQGLCILIHMYVNRQDFSHRQIFKEGERNCRRCKWL